MPPTFAQIVPWFSIPDVANEWAKETHEPSYIIEAALYEYWQEWISAVGIDYDAVEWKFRDEARYEDALFDLDDNWIDKPSADDILVKRLFIEGFCSSRKMKLPIFWFAPERKDFQPSYPGRPSIMYVIHEELRRRAKEGSLEVSLAEQARVLSEWGEKKFPGQQPPKPKSTENGIRKLYWTLRKTPSN